MTFHHIFQKLRTYQKSQYRQIQFCTGFAVMLISSYLMMLFSPLIQYTLPVGGDSRKQIYFIFGLAAIGCSLFSIYANGLFLRHKSREMGVFLALGADKKTIQKALLTEMTEITVKFSFLGILAGALASLAFGTLIQVLAADAAKENFGFTFSGISTSLLYMIIVTVIALLQSFIFLKRSNLMDILQEQRKQEPLRNHVNQKYLFISILLFLIGIITAFLLPSFVLNLTNHILGGWTNLFYLLAIVGLYRILVYSVSCHKKGRRPQHYYNHMISYGMLKFTGASVVRNMLVITLLIMGCLFALFYVPLTNLSAKEVFKEVEDSYSYFYPQNAKELTQEEVEKLADSYKVTIEDYREAEFLSVVGSGILSNDFDENGNLLKEYMEQFAMYLCISEEEFNRVTGDNVEVSSGTYYLIQSKNAKETIYSRFDDMDRLYLMDDKNYLPMEYSGNITYRSLTDNSGFNDNARYVVSNEDYQILKNNAPSNRMVTHVLFDTEESSAAVEFSRDLYRQFALRQSEDMKVCNYYNSWQAKMEGDDYGYKDIPVIYNPDNSIPETDWRYAPTFLHLQQSNFTLTFMVFFLLFLYVAVICFASVAIIAYTRSISVAMQNQQVFEDIKKLGANPTYRLHLLKEQIRKIFLLPSIIGCTGIYLFELLLLAGNDGRITSDESMQMVVTLIIIGCFLLCQWVIYHLSEKRAAAILNLHS